MQKSTEQLIEGARNLLKDYGYFVERLWHVDDVYLLCEQRGWPRLSHEEAKEVFMIFSELYEGECGLSWPKLEQATQVYLAQGGRITQMTYTRNLSAESLEQLIDD